uniref:NBS-containing resistance-like protein n=1 Tax=Tanacetum cinerariifolium TaxID=118510 RepID=A0A6L2L532_TANCI|nr:NBS-containing resistance-like protein [Tanacetum cinerariifolium]
MHNPQKPHLNVMKRVLCYLRGTTDLGLQLFQSTTSQHIAYSDTDLADYPATRRSTSGNCVFLGDNLLTWSSKRHDTLSRFSAEAEYHGVANVVAETSWIRNLLLENDLDENLKQNELLKNRILEASLAKDIKNLVITSCVEIRNKDLHDETERISKELKDVSNESKTADAVCNDSFEVTQELSKRIVELEKDLSKFEAKRKPPAEKLLITSQLSNSLFTPNIVVKNDLLKPVTTQSLPKNEKDQLLKQIASLESKLASQDIRSCQKEYHELRTSYNALKVKFDSLNRKRRALVFILEIALLFLRFESEDKDDSLCFPKMPSITMHSIFTYGKLKSLTSQSLNCVLNAFDFPSISVAFSLQDKDAMRVD